MEYFTQSNLLVILHGPKAANGWVQSEQLSNTNASDAQYNNKTLSL